MALWSNKVHASYIMFIFQNSLHWMKDTYPGFVWRSQEKTRLELEPQMESFVVEPQKREGMSIKGPNTVCFF